ncbi:MAG: hypothetical protein DME55_00525 [Verrucomicrobia bacterium]|nr:MAG: hypothetical protein DME55_00525 [Verrucomicrobiota bacterium]
MATLYREVKRNPNLLGADSMLRRRSAEVPFETKVDRENFRSGTLIYSGTGDYFSHAHLDCHKGMPGIASSAKRA